ISPFYNRLVVGVLVRERRILIAQEPTGAGGDVIWRGIGPTQLADVVWVQWAAVGVVKLEVQGKYSPRAGVAGPAQELASLHVDGRGRRAERDIVGDRGEMAVVGVVGRAVDVVLDPDGVALPGGAVAASLAIGRRDHGEGVPTAHVAVAAVDEVDAAV